MLSEAFEIKGVLYQEKNQLTDAKICFKCAIKYRKNLGEIDNTLAWLHYCLGLCEESLLEKLEAEESYLEYLKILQANKNFVSVQGELLFAEGLIKRIQEKSNYLEPLNKAFAFFLNEKDEKFVCHAGYELGISYANEKKYNQALEVFEKIKPYVVHRYGEKHSKTGTILYWIGFMNYNLANYHQAEETLQRSLELVRKRKSHLHLGYVHLELGSTYEALCQYQKALDAYDQASKYFEKDSMEGVSIDDFRGNVLFEMGKYQESLMCYLRCCEKYMEIYGDDNVNTADSYVNVAKGYWKRGEYGNALVYLHKAEKIYKEVHDSNSSEIAELLTLKSDIFYDKGEYDKSLELVEKALKIDQHIYGLDHPNIAADYLNLAKALEKQHSYTRALEYAEKALEINEKKEGPESIFMARNISMIGLIECRLGKYKEGLTRQQSAIKIYEAQHYLPKEDYSDALYRKALAEYLLNDHDNAFKEAQKALNIKVSICSANVADYYHLLGQIAKAQKKSEDAIVFLMKSLEMKKILFENHPNPEIIQLEKEITSIQENLQK